MLFISSMNNGFHQSIVDDAKIFGLSNYKHGAAINWDGEDCRGSKEQEFFFFFKIQESKFWEKRLGWRYINHIYEIHILLNTYITYMYMCVSIRANMVYVCIYMIIYIYISAHYCRWYKAMRQDEIIKGVDITREGKWIKDWTLGPSVLKGLRDEEVT